VRFLCQSGHTYDLSSDELPAGIHRLGNVLFINFSNPAVQPSDASIGSISQVSIGDDAGRLVDDIERRLTIEEALTQQMLDGYGISA
jgi:hypothetical protein